MNWDKLFSLGMIEKREIKKNEKEEVLRNIIRERNN